MSNIVNIHVQYCKHFDKKLAFYQIQKFQKYALKSIYINRNILQKSTITKINDIDKKVHMNLKKIYDVSDSHKSFFCFEI